LAELDASRPIAAPSGLTHQEPSQGSGERFNAKTQKRKERTFHISTYYISTSLRLCVFAPLRLCVKSLHSRPNALAELLDQNSDHVARAKKNEPPRRQERQEEKKILAPLAAWRFDFLLFRAV
jgi:hypothetical protein